MATQLSGNMAELDFATIKANIITSLQGNPIFKDYNFNGSTISMLLDILSYVTHYQGLYANMAFSERFLETARMRSSVVSIARELGYTPRQAQGAVASFTLTVPLSDTYYSNWTQPPSTITLSKGTEFVGKTTDNKNHQFQASVDSPLTLDGSNNYVGTVQIVQGTTFIETFTYDALASQTKFSLLNSSIDINSIQVWVGPNPWTISENILKNSQTSEIFYIEEDYNSNITVYFGGDVIGAAPANNSNITISYISCDGSASNLAGGFSLSKSFGGIPLSSATISNIVRASGGTDIETIDQIRSDAPSAYQAHNRAVTTNDYYAIINANIGWVGSMYVWGGETENPPQYGKIFVSVQPADDLPGTLSSPKRTELQQLLDSKKIIGLEVNILTPLPIYVNTNAFVRYNANVATSDQVVITAASNAIGSYFTSIGKLSMNSALQYSKFLDAIDLSNPTIASSEAKIDIEVRAKSPDGSAQFGELPRSITNTSFYNPIILSTFSSTVTEADGIVTTLGSGVAIDTIWNKIVVVSTTATAGTANNHPAAGTTVGKINATTGEMIFNTYRWDGTTVTDSATLILPTNVNQSPTTPDASFPYIIDGSSVSFGALPVHNNIQSIKNSLIVEGTTTVTASAI